MDKYYLAYEERYKQIHSQGILWFSNNPTKEVIEWTNNLSINKEDKICEVGCGEGRDTIYLSSLGYNVLGIDVSKSAIDKCREIAKYKNLNTTFKVADGLYLKDMINDKYKWIYSVGTLHMLVEEEDRRRFLKSIYDILEDDGSLLLVNMGDGKTEKMTSKNEKLEYEEELANGNIEKIKVIPCKFINIDSHISELQEIGFIVDNINITENDIYGKCITTYASKTSYI